MGLKIQGTEMSGTDFYNGIKIYASYAQKTATKYEVIRTV
jgi:hypothetical protein